MRSSLGFPMLFHGPEKGETLIPLTPFSHHGPLCSRKLRLVEEGGERVREGGFAPLSHRHLPPLP